MGVDLKPVLEHINGPSAIVWPALIYREDVISIMVAHGKPGTAGQLTEVVLGRFCDDDPVWASAFDTVIHVRRPGDMTIGEANDLRRVIIEKLQENLSHVEEHGSDLSLAMAHAAIFPSAESRKILNDIAAERGCE